MQLGDACCTLARMKQVAAVLATVLAVGGCDGKPAVDRKEAAAVAAAQASISGGGSSSASGSASGSAEPPRADVDKVLDDVVAAFARGENPNKIVIGGNNAKPQMGLFALTKGDAKAVGAAMDAGLKSAFDLALAKAKKSWAGDRNFCSDSVRMTIGYFGTDGMLDDDDWKPWKTADLAALKAKHLPAILEMHKQMIGEDDPAACEASLTTYVEALRYAATEQLELLNFGY